LTLNQEQISELETPSKQPPVLGFKKSAIARWRGAYRACEIDILFGGRPDKAFTPPSGNPFK
ncbi:hypothetical protein C9F07_16515, partial [Salmonella enterica subsp. enterica serovar Poona]